MGDYTRSEWRWNQEGRGWFKIVDDEGHIRIELGPDMGGACMEDRVEWLLFSLGYIASELNQMSLRDVTRNIKDLPLQRAPPPPMD